MSDDRINDVIDRLDRLLTAMPSGIHVQSPINPPTVTPPQSNVSSAIGAGTMDLLFRTLTGVCTAGITWLVITMPVMKVNIEDLKDDVAKIEINTKDSYTQSDALRDQSAIIEKHDALDKRVYEFEQRQREGFARIQMLEAHEPIDNR